MQALLSVALLRPKAGHSGLQLEKAASYRPRLGGGSCCHIRTKMFMCHPVKNKGINRS